MSNGTPSNDPTVGERFLLKEYSRICDAFFSLYVQVNQTVGTYVTLLAAGAGGSALLLQVIPNLVRTSTGNPTPAFGGDLWILGLLFALLSVLGFTIAMILIGLRLEMLLYARTINSLRRYFAVRSPEIQHYLVLPVTVKFPRLFEGASHHFFWEISLVGVLNSSLAVVGVVLIWGLPFSGCSAILEALFVLLVAAGHLGIYYYQASSAESSFLKDHGQHAAAAASSPSDCEFCQSKSKDGKTK